MSMYNDQKGFSLVELIIVVALIAILSGVAGYGFSLVDGKPATECANKIVAVIKHGGTMCMGKDSTTLELYRDDDGIYIKETIVSWTDERTKKSSDRVYVVGRKDVKVEYAGASGLVSLESASLKLNFNRSDGTINAGGCSGIVVSKAGTTRVVDIVESTGSVSLQ